MFCFFLFLLQFRGYIAVTPQERGKGYGRRLVEHVCQCCAEEKVEKVTLFSKRELAPWFVWMFLISSIQKFCFVRSQQVPTYTKALLLVLRII